MTPLCLYLRYAEASLRAQLQYRSSSMALAVSQLILTTSEFVAIWALFQRFDSIGGYGIRHVAVLYGMAGASFAICEIFGRGFDGFSVQILSGDFDRMLLRPRGTTFQIMASELHLGRTGRLLQALVVLAWGLSGLELSWTFGHACLLPLAILGGACLFLGLFVVHATLAFFTTQGLEIMNTVTYGGVETAHFPLSIYEDWFQRFFTFIVPLACLNYFPAQILFGASAPHPSPAWLGWVSPLAGPVFLALSSQVWKVGVRHYCSTGA